MTPRKATQAEIDKILGDTADRDCVYGFVWIRDQDTGAEAFGLRGIEKNANIKGTEKGNTHLNMACIRAERLALDRQYPGEMPPNIEVVDERYFEADMPGVGKVNTSTGEIIEGEARELEPGPKEHWCQEHNCTFEKKKRGSSAWYAHKRADGTWCNEIKKKTAAPAAEAELGSEPEPEPESEPDEKAGFVDLGWLTESLKTMRATDLQLWTETNLISYMKLTYSVEADTVLECVAKLDQGQAAHFVKKIQDTLEML